MRRGAILLSVGVGLLGAETGLAQSLDGRWSAVESCAGRPTGRSYVLTIDGRIMTARLAGSNLESFGSILGTTVLLPNDSFVIDIPVGGSDGKVSYSGRLNPVGRSSGSGGLWEGGSHRPCQISISRLGTAPEIGGKPTTSAGRPEPIPSARTPGPRTEPIPAGPPPATLGPDGVWRGPGGAAPDISATPAPRPPARPAPAPSPAPTPAPAPPIARPAPAPTPAPAAGNEMEALRQQLEEERRRRAMAESALRLQEELRRQGGTAPPAQ
jgi:hypothetical protein